MGILQEMIKTEKDITLSEEYALIKQDILENSKTVTFNLSSKLHERMKRFSKEQLASMNVIMSLVIERELKEIGR